MLSNRLILIFLGIILSLVVVLTSNRISAALRERFGGFVPGLILPAQEEITPTPTSPQVTMKTLTSTPTVTPKPTIVPLEKGTPADKIPATGPSLMALILLGGTFVLGAAFRKLSTQT